MLNSNKKIFEAITKIGDPRTEPCDTTQFIGIKSELNPLIGVNSLWPDNEDLDQLLHIPRFP